MSNEQIIAAGFFAFSAVSFAKDRMIFMVVMWVIGILFLGPPK